MRILAMQGCVKDILGHVSARIPGTNEMFIRCRGDNERGLLYTDIQQIRRLDFEEKSGDMRDDYMVPVEVPIHGEIYKAIPDAQAVVHAHPYASVVCGIAGLELRPIFGAFDPPSLAIAARGIPVYPRSVLINRADLAGINPCTICRNTVCGDGTSLFSSVSLIIKLLSCLKLVIGSPNSRI